MISVIAECAKLIPIVLRRDCQDGNSDFLELLARWHHRVVVRIERGMFEDALKIDGRISDKRVQRFEWNMFLVSVEELRSPKFLITEKALLSCPAAGERVPLHVVG